MLSPDFVGLGDEVSSSSLAGRSPLNTRSDKTTSEPPKTPQGSQRGKLMRQASKNWNIVRSGLGKLAGSITKSMEHTSVHSSNTAKNRSNRSDEYYPLDQFQEQYV